MKLDVVEVVVPAALGAALGGLFGGRKAAMWLGAGGAGLGLVMSATNKGHENMGRGQRFVQGVSGQLAGIGLDPIDVLPGGV